MFLEQCLSAKKLYSQPFGQGMIYRDINSIEDSLDVANFISFYEKTSGKAAYKIEEVAWHRGFITKKEYAELT
jgi:dTDP-glucose pyrophosphorylase